MNEMITSPHEQQNEDYPQLTIADTDWTDEEQSIVGRPRHSHQRETC